MATVRDTRAMLAGMTPVLKRGSFFFCITNDTALIEQAQAAALSWFQEDEGIALILELKIAASLGFDVTMPMSRIVLEVFSALDGVGATAAISTALAGDDIPCNVVSAYHHDNVFVPVAHGRQGHAHPAINPNAGSDWRASEPPVTSRAAPSVKRPLADTALGAS